MSESVRQPKLMLSVMVKVCQRSLFMAVPTQEREPSMTVSGTDTAITCSNYLACSDHSEFAMFTCWLLLLEPCHSRDQASDDGV